MKPLRILCSAALALLFAFAISACQKSAQTDMSSTTDTTQVSQGYGNTTTPEPASPQTAPGAQGATSAKSTAKSTTKNAKSVSSMPSGASSNKGTSAMNAEKHTIEIPVGTNLDVEMVTPVDTRTSNVGDHVDAKLATPLVVNGVLVADAGASVTGQVSDLKRASKGKGDDDRAFIALAFTEIATVDGPKTLHATVSNAEGKLQAKSTSTRDKLLIGGGAVAGAIVGKVAGGSTKSTIIGAVAGAAAGTGAMLVAKGHELEIPAGAKVSLRVDQPILIVQR